MITSLSYREGITYYGIGGDEYESIGSIIDIPGALDTKKKWKCRINTYSLVDNCNSHYLIE